MTVSKKPIERYKQFEVIIEPKFVPGEGTFISEKFRTITINVYARDILEAIDKAKAVIDMPEDEVEIVSVMGSHFYTRYRRDD